MRNRFLYYIAGALILLSSCQKSNEKLIDKWIFISISNSCGDRGCKDDIKEVAFLCCFEQNKRYNQFLTFTDENLFKKDLRNKNSDRFYYGETGGYYIKKDRISIIYYHDFTENKQKYPTDTIAYSYKIHNDTLTLLLVKEGVNTMVANFARVKTSGNSPDSKTTTTDCEFLIGDWVQEGEMKSMPNSEWRLTVINIEGTLIFKTGRVAKTSKDIPGHETRSEGRITCTDNIPYLDGMGMVKDEEIKIIRDGKAILFGTKVYVRK